MREFIGDLTIAILHTFQRGKVDVTWRIEFGGVYFITVSIFGRPCTFHLTHGFHDKDVKRLNSPLLLKKRQDFVDYVRRSYEDAKRDHKRRQCPK